MPDFYFFILKQNLTKLQKASLSSWGWLRTQILLSQLLKFWDYKRAPPCQTYFLFWNRVLLSCWGWPQTYNPPVSAFQVLELQAYTTTPSLSFCLPPVYSNIIRDLFAVRGGLPRRLKGSFAEDGKEKGPRTFIHRGDESQHHDELLFLTQCGGCNQKHIYPYEGIFFWQ